MWTNVGVLTVEQCTPNHHIIPTSVDCSMPRFLMGSIRFALLQYESSVAG